MTKMIYVLVYTFTLRIAIVLNVYFLRPYTFALDVVVFLASYSEYPAFEVCLYCVKVFTRFSTTSRLPVIFVLEYDQAAAVLTFGSCRVAQPL